MGREVGKRGGWGCWLEGEGVVRFRAVTLPLLLCSSEHPPNLKYADDDRAKTGDWVEEHSCSPVS